MPILDIGNAQVRTLDERAAIFLPEGEAGLNLGNALETHEVPLLRNILHPDVAGGPNFSIFRHATRDYTLDCRFA
jgi:hypothetical protein